MDFSKYKAAILYKPLKNEIDYNDPSFPFKIASNKLLLPNDKSEDWLICAAEDYRKTKYKDPKMELRNILSRNKYGHSQQEQSRWVRNSELDVNELAKTMNCFMIFHRDFKSKISAVL